MATTLKTKNSVTTTVTPTSLAQGELAVNITDKKMWVGNAATTPVQILGAGATNRAGGSNTQVQYNSSGDLAGSANFTYDGSNLGLGSFTGSVAYTNTLKIDTAGGNPYYAGVNLYDGGVLKAYIRTSSGTDGALKFATNATERMVIDVNGNVSAGNIALLTGTGYAGVNTTSAVPLIFYTNSTERMRLDASNGNLSIGTTNSSGKLTLQMASGVGCVAYKSTTGGFTAHQFYTSNENVVGTIGVTSTNDTFYLGYTSTAVLTWNSSGKVAINTAGSASAFCVNATSVGSYTHINNGNTAPNGSIPWFATLNGLNAATADYGWTWYDSNSTGNLELYRRNGSVTGDQVVSYSRSTGQQYNNGTTGGFGEYWGIRANANTYQVMGLQDTGTTGGNYMYFVNSAGNGAGTITHNGTTTVAYNTSSDYRLKENIAPMTGALSKVAQLKPVTYTWKEDGSDGQGFIAHELQSVVPDAVTGQKDAEEIIGNIIDSEGKVLVEKIKEPLSLDEGRTWVKTGTRPVYQGIDTSFLVATLTAAIQEQQTLIESLTIRLNALEGK